MFREIKSRAILLKKRKGGTNAVNYIIFTHNFIAEGCVSMMKMNALHMVYKSPEFKRNGPGEI